MKKKWRNSRFLLALLCAAIAGAGLAVGVSLSWFVAGKQLSTVAKIQKPAELKILNPDESQMTKIDLSYSEDEITRDDKGTTVTIQRPIMVESGKDYNLILAHTTNISGMTIKLYRAQETTINESNTENKQYDISYPGSTGKYIYWKKFEDDEDKDIFTEGKYLNIDKETAEKIADKQYNNKTFEQNEVDKKIIQKNASPLYWSKLEKVTDGINKYIEPIKGTGNTETVYRFRYILELSWTETEKETDIFYVIAKS